MPWKLAIPAFLLCFSPCLHVIYPASSDCSCISSPSTESEWPPAALIAASGCKTVAEIWLDLSIYGWDAISSDFYEFIVRGPDAESLSGLIVWRLKWDKHTQSDLLQNHMQVTSCSSKLQYGWLLSERNHTFLHFKFLLLVKNTYISKNNVRHSFIYLHKLVAHRW